MRWWLRSLSLSLCLSLSLSLTVSNNLWESARLGKSLMGEQTHGGVFKLITLVSGQPE